MENIEEKNLIYLGILVEEDIDYQLNQEKSTFFDKLKLKISNFSKRFKDPIIE